MRHRPRRRCGSRTRCTASTDQGVNGMDKLDPRVEKGLAKLLDTRPVFDERRKAYAGEHDLPFAPQGASAEYMELRKMAALPLVRLAVRTASQRLRSTGVRTSAGEEFDRGLWR